jgi:hypothetical protein
MAVKKMNKNLTRCRAIVRWQETLDLRTIFYFSNIRSEGRQTADR